MKNWFKILVLMALFNGQVYSAPRPNPRVTISGYIYDQNGEVLIGTNVYIKDLELGTTSNDYGYYSVSFPSGDHELIWSYIGHESYSLKARFTKDTSLNIFLHRIPQSLEAVQISAKIDSHQLNNLRLNRYQLTTKNLEELPAIGGEPDLLKAIQLLPGIQATSEGLASFVVRGGNYDQNLIVLDEAIVYNPSHLLGFFSIFNADILKNSKIYKGDIPAKFGGRLSSLLEVNLRDGNKKEISGSGGIGTISSKVTLESPILNKKGSVLISGRRSYADIFLPLSKNQEVRNNRIYFFDTYLKANYQFNQKNRLFLSSYFGRDVFKYKNQYYVSSGNITGSVRWNHLFGQKMFSNLSLIYSQYDYLLGQETDVTGVEWDAFLSDSRLKYDFTWYINPKNTLKFGLTTAFLKFKPGTIIAGDSTSVFNDFKIPDKQSLESAIYIMNDQEIGSRLKLSYGIRGTLYQNLGPATVYKFNTDFVKTDSIAYPTGKIYHSFTGFEPRADLTYLISKRSVISGSYNRTLQNIFLISNSTAGTPVDIWTPSGPNIMPQIANQFTLGYQQNLNRNLLEISLEVYYKKMRNQVDFKDHANLILNPEFEGELRFGQINAYGLEILIKKSFGKWDGMFGYTLSKANKHFPDLNTGKDFPASYDRRHDLSLLLTWEPGRRWKISATGIYLSGSPYTIPVGRFNFGNIIVPIYSERNAYRMPDYFRLDLAATLKGKIKPGKKFSGDFNFSIYNVTNRKNAWIIYFQSDRNNLLQTHAYKLYLFPIIPSLSYSFKF